MLDKIMESCKYLLETYPEAEECRSYLNSRVSEKAKEMFNFGYFPNINNISILTSLIGEDVLFQESLIKEKYIEDSLGPRKIKFCHFENHPLVMSYKDAYGKTVALIGRSLLSDSQRQFSKYKYTFFNKSNHLFGLYENKQSIIDNGCVYIVEGQFDVIKATEKGFTNIVSLGGSDMSSYQFSVITRYTDNILLLLDNDEAGQKGRKRIADKFSQYATIHQFYVPEPYKDIDEYLSDHSYESMSLIMK